MSLKELADFIRAEVGLTFRIGLELEFLLVGPTVATVIQKLKRPDLYTLVQERAQDQYEMVFPHTDDVQSLALNVEEARSYAVALVKAGGSELILDGLPKGSEAVQGMHIHVNAEVDGKNAFYGEKGSVLLRACVAGMLERMSACLKIMVPVGASYQRFRLNSPMSPSRIAWGVDNRSCALRIPPSASAAKRVECRVPTPDADVDAVIRAVMLCAASGAARAESIVCPPPIYGNAYDPQYGLQPFPFSLEGAKAIKDPLIDGPYLPPSGALLLPPPTP